MNLLRRHSVDYVTSYRQVCQQAADYDAVFETFRQNPAYTPMLEHATESRGGQCQYLIRQNAEIYAAMEEFKRNDTVGGPELVEYPEIGKVAPSTLVYVKVLMDLTELFGSLEGGSICEIGVGYGGQCRIIDAYCDPLTYHLVDIPPALRLTQRYLDHFVLHGRVSYETMNEVCGYPTNLVISNYAYSELPKDVQDAYFEKIIRRSMYGYMTYNHIQPEGMCYTAEEIAARIPGARIYREIPQTHPANCIIAWGPSLGHMTMEDYECVQF